MTYGQTNDFSDVIAVPVKTLFNTMCDVNSALRTTGAKTLEMSGWQAGLAMEACRPSPKDMLLKPAELDFLINTVISARQTIIQACGQYREDKTLRFMAKFSQSAAVRLAARDKHVAELNAHDIKLNQDMDRLMTAQDGRLLNQTAFKAGQPRLISA